MSENSTLNTLSASLEKREREIIEREAERQTLLADGLRKSLEFELGTLKRDIKSSVGEMRGEIRRLKTRRFTLPLLLTAGVTIGAVIGLSVLSLHIKDQSQKLTQIKSEIQEKKNDLKMLIEAERKLKNKPKRSRRKR